MTVTAPPARARADMDALQELELKSDGVALLTLVAMGLDPAPLASGVRKLTRFNERLGATGNAAAYPTLAKRLHFIHDLTERLGHHSRTS